MDVSTEGNHRSILVIEQEHQLRMALLTALSEKNWKVHLALTEETIEQTIQKVGGVIFSTDLPPAVNLERLMKLIGNLPHIIAQKPYSVTEIVRETEIRIGNDQFEIGNHVMSKTTPDWGVGTIVNVYPEQYYGVIFKQSGSSEIAIRCHGTGLTLVVS